MRLFLLALTLLAPPISAYARTSCEQAALSSTKTHLIITMEGLMGGVDGRAAAMARRSVAAASSGATVVPFSYTQVAQAAACAEVWKRLYGERLKITFVGHSFGGGRGALPLMNSLAAKGIQVNEMVILDGRVCDQNSGIMCREENACANDGGRVLTRPPNVGRVFNFYQCGGGLQGRKFREDGRVQNIQVNSSHIGMPRHEYPNRFLAGLLRGSDSAELNVAQTESTTYTAPSFQPVRSTVRGGLTSWCFQMGGAVRYRCSYNEASRVNSGSDGNR